MASILRLSSLSLFLIILTFATCKYPLRVNGDPSDIVCQKAPKEFQQYCYKCFFNYPGSKYADLQTQVNALINCALTEAKRVQEIRYNFCDLHKNDTVTVPCVGCNGCYRVIIHSLVSALQDMDKRLFKESETKVSDAIKNHQKCITLLNLSKYPIPYTLGGALDTFRGFAEVAASVITQLIH